MQFENSNELVKFHKLLEKHIKNLLYVLLLYLLSFEINFASYKFDIAIIADIMLLKIIYNLDEKTLGNWMYLYFVMLISNIGSKVMGIVALGDTFHLDLDFEYLIIASTLYLISQNYPAFKKIDKILSYTLIIAISHIIIICLVLFVAPVAVFIAGISKLIPFETLLLGWLGTTAPLIIALLTLIIFLLISLYKMKQALTDFNPYENMHLCNNEHAETQEDS